MSSKISYFKTKRFLQTGSFDQSGSKCTIEGLIFKKGNAFSHQEVEQVISFCNQYKDSNISTIVVKGENDLTIWIEDKYLASDKSKDRQFSAEEQLLTDSHPLPTKTVVKKYRGQEYQETIVDWAAVQQIDRQKPRRKYRGQYID